MKKLLLLVPLAVLIVLLQQCTPDPPADCTNCNDPDSLYVSTPYTLNPKFFNFPPINLPGDNPLTVEGIRLGRMLFYDPVLSADSTISCASCHKQEFAFSDGGKRFSTNVFGLTTRNTPPLFNLIWMKDFFWDGRSKSLPAQANDALLHEQNFNPNLVIPRLQAQPEYVRLFKKAFGRPGDITQEKIEKAIAQFEMTLVSGNSRFDSVMRSQAFFTEAESRGLYNLFRVDTPAKGADCLHCHLATGSEFLTLIDNNFHNNALDASATFNGFADQGLGKITGNQFDNGRFRTPHVRNIEVTGPYMHDGRFATLEEVVEFYNTGLKQSPTVDPNMKAAHQGGLQYLTEQDKADLVAFLKTLTDHVFLTDTAYSNPFK